MVDGLALGVIIVGRCIANVGRGFSSGASASAPPGSLGTDLLWLQGEALHSEDIEEEIPHHVRIIVSGHQQTSAEAKTKAVIHLSVIYFSLIIEFVKVLLKKEKLHNVGRLSFL